jgi:hypothetical protein
MQINNTGHVVNSKGITTTPHFSPYWLGDDTHRIAFDFLVLGNGRVALHADYGNTLRQCHSEFFYDVIDCDKAIVSAQNLIGSAISLMQAHNPDIELDTDRANDFLSAVAGDIVKHKRSGFYVVASR